MCGPNGRKELMKVSDAKHDQRLVTALASTITKRWSCLAVEIPLALKESRTGELPVSLGAAILWEGTDIFISNEVPNIYMLR